MVLTQDDTTCKGVERVPFFTATSAPCSIKTLTDSALHRADTMCKGVEPVLSRAVTSAPCLINKRIVSAFALGSARRGHSVTSFSCRFASALHRDRMTNSGAHPRRCKVERGLVVPIECGDIRTVLNQ